MTMLRLALIGCGGHSEAAHAAPLQYYAALHPSEIQLAACCDIQQERAARFCQRFGFAKAYTNWERMLDAERPDAVFCIVPIEQTLSVGGELLKRHLPCVLEKPPGTSLQEVAMLTGISRETGTPHLVSVNRRFNPYLNRALAAIKEAGPLRYVHCRMLRHGRRENEFFWGTAIHVIDALRHIGGEWQDFSVRTVQPPHSSAPWYIVSFRYASGCAGTVEILTTVGMVEETFDLYGEGIRASVTTLGGPGESARFWRDGVLEWEDWAASSTPAYLRDGSYEELTAFLNAVRSGTAPAPTVADIAPTMNICARLGASLDAGGSE